MRELAYFAAGSANVTSARLRNKTGGMRMRPMKIYNFQEILVNERIKAFSTNYPSITSDGRLEDIACIALNALKPRYVRNLADLNHYMTDDQRCTYEAEAGAAVRAAFEFVLFERSGSPEHPAATD